jgi:hypothetical protein
MEYALIQIERALNVRPPQVEPTFRGLDFAQAHRAEYRLQC